MERYIPWSCLAASGLLCILMTLTGCSLQKTYRYEEIKASHAVPVGMRPWQGAEAPGPRAAAHGPLSCAEAIAIALQKNPGNQMALARIRQTEAALQQANAAFYPTLGFYTEYTHADAPSVYLFKKIDQRQLPPAADFNNPGRLDNFESGVRGQLNLANGGRDYLNRRMAQTGLAISQLDQESVENGLIASVISAYYEVLATREFIGIARDSVATVRKELELMRVRLRGGSALKADLLSLEARLAHSQEELVQSRNHHQTALTALATLLGMDQDAEVVLAEPDDFGAAALPRTYRQGLAYALAQRPVLKKLQAQVQKTAMAVDAAHSTYLPRLDVQGKYYLDDEELAYDSRRENWMVAVILNWDIFTGFSRRAAVDTAAAQLLETLAADRQTRLAVKGDVKRAYQNLEAAGARLAAAQRSAAAAEESLALVLTQFQGGSATITRYLQAELDWNRARLRATAAHYDRQKALAQIGRSIGYWAKAKEAQ
ncbi:MAG: TolC family protein [Deltaproteobacteria bacterium]|jgi:outer membrane protein|nr:TolC family protein [Deltaproteobacteria bacterium]